MSEADGLSYPCHLPSDCFKQNDVVIIILPDLLIQSVIHGLQVPSVSNTREEKSWILEDITTPGLIHQLISNNNLSISKCLGHFTPEQSKFLK